MAKPIRHKAAQNHYDNIQILPFDKGGNNLAKALSNESTTPISVIKRKDHWKFLKGYLSKDNNGLNVKTIVIEDRYISKDFLDDYTGYFASCFENYSKYCKRVHFFSKQFTQKDFDKLEIKNKNTLENFFGSYKGNIVVKRIPYSVIGYTILDTYSDNSNNKKELFGTKNYTINFLGIKYNIKSLAYQEQDSVLSACATSAIWSVLNKASDNPRTSLKSPIEITASTGKIDSESGRLFPNKGLSLEQMIKAFFEANLVTENINGYDINYAIESEAKPLHLNNNYIRELIYAYAPIGIPIVLILKTYGGKKRSDLNEKEIDKNEKPVPRGLHAVAVTGYKKFEKSIGQMLSGEENTIATDGLKKYFTSKNIERIYVHDDQYGPFAKCEFLNESDLISCWDKYKPGRTKIPSKRIEFAQISDVLIPLFPKIRISYDDFMRNQGAVLINLFHFLLHIICKSSGQKKPNVEWDIQLEYSSNYKERIINEVINPKKKKNILTENLPKYIWRASLKIANKKYMDFLFDATDVHNGNYFIDVLCHAKKGDKLMIDMIKSFKLNSNEFVKIVIKEFKPNFSINKYCEKLGMKLEDNLL